jgi:hypothetical protein
MDSIRFARKTKYGFCACAITFQVAYTLNEISFVFSVFASGFPTYTSCASRIKCVVNDRAIDAVIHTRVLCERMGVQDFLIFSTPLMKLKSFLGFAAVSFGNCLSLGTASCSRILEFLASPLSFHFLCFVTGGLCTNGRMFYL